MLAYDSHLLILIRALKLERSWLSILNAQPIHYSKKETVELITNAHPDNRYLLGDEGYLGKNLHQRLEQIGYTLWTPYRKNIKNAQKHNKHYLMALRRTIESDFLLLSYYNAENNRARSSLAGFQE